VRLTNLRDLDLSTFLYSLLNLGPEKFRLHVDHTHNLFPSLWLKRHWITVGFVAVIRPQNGVYGLVRASDDMDVPRIPHEELGLLLRDPVATVRVLALHERKHSAIPADQIYRLPDNLYKHAAGTEAIHDRGLVAIHSGSASHRPYLQWLAIRDATSLSSRHTERAAKAAATKRTMQKTIAAASATVSKRLIVPDLRRASSRRSRDVRDSSR
jgi:hypothetical protein